MRFDRLEPLFNEAVKAGLLDTRDYEGLHPSVAEIKKINDLQELIDTGVLEAQLQLASLNETHSGTAIAVTFALISIGVTTLFFSIVPTDFTRSYYGIVGAGELVLAYIVYRLIRNR